MERLPLASRSIRSAGYDEQSRTLELEFASGRIYEFDDVPRSVYDWLRRTRSKGAFVARMINGHYRYRDTTDPVAEACDLEAALRASLAEFEPKR